MHGFRDNEVLLQAGYDVIVISPPGGASSYFTWRILKGRPRLYIDVQLTLFVYLEQFRRYSTLLIWLGFPYWRRNFGGFGQNDPPNVKLEKNTSWEGTSIRQTASFEPLCVKLSLSVWPVQVRKKKGSKAGRQEGRKVTRSVYFTYVWATPSGRIPTKLGTCVRFTDVIKRAKFHPYYLRGFGAVRCWS